MRPTRDVVSATFTGYDGWQRPAGEALCPACTWGYTGAGLRASAHLVEGHPPGLAALTRAGLLALLLAGMVPGDRAVVVPLRPGRKHLLPVARWGMVTLDNTWVRWGAGDAGRLSTMLWLRSLGFGSRQLLSPAPAYPVLARHPAGMVRAVLAAWAALDVWRTGDNPWLALAVHASTPEAA